MIQTHSSMSVQMEGLLKYLPHFIHHGIVQLLPHFILWLLPVLTGGSILPSPGKWVPLPSLIILCVKPKMPN